MPTLSTRVLTVATAVVAILLGSSFLVPQDVQAGPSENPDPIPPRKHDRFNPPYPRIGIYSWQNSGWPRHSFGSRLEKLEHYDQVWLEGGLDDDGEMKSDELKKLNGSNFYIAMTKNGLWFYDPPEYFAYRSYQGALTAAINPGDRNIPVDTTVDIQSGGGPTPKTVVIADNLNFDNAEVVEFYDYDENTVYVPDYGSDADEDNDYYMVTKYHPAGSVVLSPLRLSGPGIMPNFSYKAAMKNSEGTVIWDYLAEKTIVRDLAWDRCIYDGIAHDFMAYTIYMEAYTIDLNLNGVSDYDEMGDEAIMDDWRAGYRAWYEAEKAKMEQLCPTSTNMITVNNGGTMPDYYDILHGHVYEGFMRWSSWGFMRDNELEWMELGQKPGINLMQDTIYEHRVVDGKNNFAKMRYGLTTAMIFDNYYGMTFGDYYYLLVWYDEFDTDIGYPTTGPIKMSGTPFKLPWEKSDSLWVRFFDDGVAITNPTEENRTLLPSDLEGLTGYDGPYYRMKGGQDPLMNNGELFDGDDQILLEASNERQGNGIIMFKFPVTQVTDIIIDNFHTNDTSPAQVPVELLPEGEWQRKTALVVNPEDIRDNNPFWSQLSDRSYICSHGGCFDEAYGYHVTEAGGGEATATYRATINVPGRYEIYEWHGWHGDGRDDYTEASNVPYRIVIDGTVVKSGTIDQTTGYGRWNSFGQFDLPAGEGVVRVELTNAANGWVIADAVKLRFTENTFMRRQTGPRGPKSLRVSSR